MSTKAINHADRTSSKENLGQFAGQRGDKALDPQTGAILIVDASAQRRQAILDGLAGFENPLLQAATTSEAVEAISKNAVDLVVIDLFAPESGATNFCKALRKASATRFLPIFVLTANDDLEAEVRAIEAGANEFLVAPFRMETFRARVRANLRRKAIVDSLDDSESILFSLAKSVEDRDPDLSQHCQRLSFMGAALGVAMKLGGPEIVALQRGGYLHDIGKISIPDRVLFKSGPLTPEEWEIMKSHAERGEHICSSLASLTPVLPIIRNHHERWDGSGYPDRFIKEQIPLLARILQLADIYDALITARPYKRAFAPEEALAIIWEETANGWRDPQLVEVFSEILPLFRMVGAPDLSRLSLQALASSIESFRKKSGPRSRTAATYPLQKEATPTKATNDRLTIIAG
jgi:putative two-component system response regulator